MNKKILLLLMAVLLLCGLEYSFAFKAPDEDSSVTAAPPTVLAGKKIKAGNGLLHFHQRGLKIKVTGDPVLAAIKAAKGLIAHRLKKGVGVSSTTNVLKSVMSEAKTYRDELGHTHITLVQKYKGLKVIGGEMIVHINDKGIIYQINGKSFPQVDISTTPSVSMNDALQVGLDKQDGKFEMKVEKKPELVIYAQRLAYTYVISHKGENPELWIYYVDAKTGSVLFSYNDIQYICGPAGSATGYHTTITGNRLIGEDGSQVSMEGWKENSGNYFMANANWYWTIYDLDVPAWEQNPTPNWDNADQAAVSAGNNFEYTQDATYNWLLRNSFDNADACARGNVHEGVNYVNAYWDGTDFHFGDGDGSVANALTTLDIVAHEYGHAITDYTSNLIYSYESGALNESFSDIYGAFVEFRTQPDGRASYPGSQPGYSDWLCGEDAWIPAPGALRNLRDPMSYNYPSYYKGTYWYTGTGDNGGVHTNSSVQNFAYYLLSEGGSGTNDGHPYGPITGIGWDNAARVAMRANTVYLTSSSQYADARQAWMDAASDLGFSVSTVDEVFCAIGVGCAPPCDPIPDQINDGSFENGPPPASAWTEWSDTGVEWIMDPSGIWGIPAYHCDYVFWAGGYGGVPNSDYVEQSISIPAGAASLKFKTCFYRPDADDPDFPDNFIVSINGTGVFTREMSQANDSYPNWEEQTIDISSYAGQTVTLKFEGVSAGSQTGNVLVDAIVIKSGSGVLIIQDEAPWGFTSNEEILNSLGITYDMIGFAQIENTDFGQYCMILIPSVQNSWSYFDANLAKFDTFVQNGGVLQVSLCLQDFMTPPAQLPGGVTTGHRFDETNLVADAGHPIVAGVPSPFAGNYASHNYLENLPAGTNVITVGSDGTSATTIEYTLGSGTIITSGVALEWQYSLGYDAMLMLPNMIEYAYSLCSAENVCEGDLNHDGRVNMTDWRIFREDWGRTDCSVPGDVNICEGDLNHDGRVNMTDWRIFREDWGRTDCPIQPEGYCEDFDDGVADNWVDDGSGLWSVVSGEYVMGPGIGGSVWRYSTYDGAVYSDFTYSVDVTRTAGDVNYNNTILFRVDGTGSNLYLFGYTQTGYYMVLKYENGSPVWLVSWTYSAAINTGLGAWNNLKVVCSGSTITCYINDTMVDSITDPSFASGKVGVMPVDAVPGDEVHYDNACISLDTIGVRPARQVQAITGGGDPHISP